MRWIAVLCLAVLPAMSMAGKPKSPCKGVKFKETSAGVPYWKAALFGFEVMRLQKTPEGMLLTVTATTSFPNSFSAPPSTDLGVPPGSIVHLEFDDGTHWTHTLQTPVTPQMFTNDRTGEVSANWRLPILLDDAQFKALSTMQPEMVTVDTGDKILGTGRHMIRPWGDDLKKVATCMQSGELDQ